jgi:hypothetical protein
MKTKKNTNNFKKAIALITLQAFILISTGNLGYAATNIGNATNDFLKSDALKTSSVITNYTNASKKEVSAISNSMFSRNIGLSPKLIRPEIQRLLDKAIVKNINITTTYVGYKANKMMILSPDQKLPNGYNPAERPWYTQAVKNKTGIYVSETYQDAATNNILLSMAKAVINSKGTDIIGVAGIDFDITKLCATIKSTTFTNKEIIIVYDQNMHVVVSNASDVIFNTPIASFLDGSSINKYNVTFELKCNGVNCFSYQTKEPNTGWSILALIPKF